MSIVSESTRIAVVGGGKMGEAIMGGWIAAQEGPAAGLFAANFTVANPGEPRRAFLQERYGVACVADAREISGADIVLLAVKPQVMMGVLEEIKSLEAYVGGSDGPLFVSVAAGLSTKRLEESLPESARLVRVMPNTPLFVAAGATTITRGSNASDSDVDLVCDLFASLGEAYVIDECDMDAASAVSGSGPAYVAALIEALRDAGVAQGLPADFAETLAQQTVYGTAMLMHETGQSAETTRVAVCSPKGSTLAGLEALEEAGFSQSIDACVAAAVKRNKELGQC